MLMNLNHILTLLICGVVIAAVPAAALELADEPETIYTTGEHCIVYAITDGTHVLINDYYLKFDGSTPKEELLQKGMLHVYSITDKTLTTIPGAKNIEQENVRLSGDDVCWQERRYTEDPRVAEYDVYHYSISSGVTTQLHVPRLPREGTDYELSYKPVAGPDPYAVLITAEHRNTGEKHIVSMPENADAWTIQTSGDRMVFSDMPEKGGKAMYLYDFSTKETTLLEEVQDGMLKVMDFSGDTLLYVYDSSEASKLYAKNLATGETKLLSDVLLNYDETDLDGTLAVWRGWYWNEDFSRSDRVTTPLYAAPATGRGSPILLDTGARTPFVQNNVVVWSVWDDTTNRDTIKLAAFQ